MIAKYIGLGLSVAVIAALLIFLGGALGAVIIMIGAGLLHRDVTAFPALGFWSSYGAAILLATVGNALKGTTAEIKA